MLQERSSSKALTEYQQRVINRQASSLKRLGLRLDIERVTDRFQTKLVATDLIGTMRLVDGKDHVDLVVEPKIANAAFLRMLDFCFGSMHLEDDAIAYESSDSTSALLVHFVVQQIEAFLRKRKYRNYSLKFDEEARHPKGHLDLVGYASRQLPKMHFDRLPCSYYDFSENVVENQVLAATLFIASRLASAFSLGARRAITQKIAEAKRFLPGVEVIRITEATLSRILYDRQNGAFQPIHNLCRLILFNASVSLTPSRALSFGAFSLNMNYLFESYVRRLVQRIYGSVLSPGKQWLKFAIHGTETSINLDGLIKSNPSCVIECKYKLVTGPDSIDFDEGQMRNADLYQCVAYAMHADISAREVFLVYPTAALLSPPVQAVKSIKSFIGGKGKIVPITVILINLAAPPARVLAALPSFLPLGSATEA